MPIEILIAILIIILVVAGFFLSIFPRLLYLREDIRITYKKVENILKERWMLIPKFIEILKSYSEKEKNTLEKLILIRNTTFENMSFEKKVDTDNELTLKLNNIDTNIRRYANIENDEKYNRLYKNYQELGEELFKTKEEYNDHVDKLNKLTSHFPTNIIALFMGFEKVDKI